MNSTILPNNTLVDSTTSSSVVAPIAISLHYLCLVFVIFLLMIAKKLLSRQTNSSISSLTDSPTSSLVSSISKFQKNIGGVKPCTSNSCV